MAKCLILVASWFSRSSPCREAGKQIGKANAEFNLVQIPRQGCPVPLFPCSVLCKGCLVALYLLVSIGPHCAAFTPHSTTPAQLILVSQSQGPHPPALCLCTSSPCSCSMPCRFVILQNISSFSLSHGPILSPSPASLRKPWCLSSSFPESQSSSTMAGTPRTFKSFKCLLRGK